MIFSLLDALLFRKRSRPAQRRVEIVVGLVCIGIGVACVFQASESWPMRLTKAAASVLGGAFLLFDAISDARREREEAGAALGNDPVVETDRRL